MRKYGFCKSMRLRDTRIIRQILKNGRRVAIERFIIHIGKKKESVGRVAIAVSKRIGKAVVRNKIKRWCREYFRTKQLWKLGSDMIIRVIRPVYSYSDVVGEMDYLIKRMKRR